MITVWSDAAGRRPGRLSVVATGAVVLFSLVVDMANDTPVSFLLVHFGITALVLGAIVLRGPARWVAAAAAVAAPACSLLATLVTFLAGSEDAPVVEVPALLLLLIAAWRRARTAAGWWLVGLVVAALVLIPVRAGNLADSGAIVAMMAVTAVVVVVAVTLRGQDDQRRSAVTSVRRAAREEIARELHDVVAHHVTGIVVATQAARTVAGNDPDAASEALASVEAAGAEALGAMRRLVGVLRTEPDAADGSGADAPRAPTPGVAELAELVGRFRAAAVVDRTELSMPADVSRLPSEVQLGVFRVVQESLTNIQRYAAGAARVDVDLDIDLGHVTVEVRNTAPEPGHGDLDPHVQVDHGGGGFGVIGMCERVEALGGALTAGPQPVGGWAVRALIPLDEPAGRIL